MDRTIEWLCQEGKCSFFAAVVALQYAKNNVFVARDYLCNEHFRAKVEREAKEGICCCIMICMW